MNQANAKPSFFIDFSKATPDAVEKILKALNAEVDEAVSQKRIPILDKALASLSPSTLTVM